MTARIDPPCDVAQPADLPLTPLAPNVVRTHGPSYYLTLPCRPFAEAVRDVSRHRDLPDWVWAELRLHRHTAEVVCLAQYRRAAK